MKTIEKIRKLCSLARILSRIAFVIAVVGAVLCLAGIISLAAGADGVLKIGGVTLHTLMVEAGEERGSVIAAMLMWMIVLIGEAVTAGYAGLCFRSELEEGTPFTEKGSDEMLKLGIICISVPLGCTVIGSIAEGIAAALMNVEKNGLPDCSIDGSVTLGVMFIFVSLLCRYGAEQKEV